MQEFKLEELVEERQFVGVLQTQSEVFFQLANTLLARGRPEKSWNKKHYFQLINEADALESFLDDFGARFNRTYAYLTEMVASLRWFAYSGYSLAHLQSRLASYGTDLWGSDEDHARASEDLEEGRRFLRDTAVALLTSIREEARKLGVEITPETFPEKNLSPMAARRKLPHDVGQEHLVDEEQRIAEVSAKFLEASKMISRSGARVFEDDAERHQFMREACTEECARVYQSTVHNLQSTYDTHIQNTILERDDPRLSRLRGHASAALHLLEVVTYMSHFIERHENEMRSEEAKRAIAVLVNRSEVERITVHVFLRWADRLLQNGAPLAEELLPSYTDVQEIEVQLRDGLALHARPAALLVNIVNHWGTPVEMEVAGQRCNAGSILELLVTVGSQPDQKSFVFRGDAHPLRHIEQLFEHGLGEDGMDHFPAELGYLRS